MECSFEERKSELEAECKVRRDLFARAANRLESFMEPFLLSYRRHEQRAHATTMVQGLCSDLSHKNCESIAYHFGLDRKTIQHFIGESRWDDRPLRDELARQVAAQFGEAGGVLVLDPSAFPKSGKQSVGVARQWCGRLGKVDNCQVAVYLGYATSNGHALVDTELYLPQEWTRDKQRMKRAGVPKDRQRFRTKHEISLVLLDRHRGQLSHRWVTGDDEMGRPAEFRRELRDRGEQYLLAVPCNTTIRDLETPAPEYSGRGRPAQRPSGRVDRWVAERSNDEWSTIEVRDGEKGPLIVEAIKRRVETGRVRSTATEEVLVVIRYRDRDHAIVKTDFYLSNADIQMALAEFCRAAKAHNRVEECFQRAKGEAGLADYEVRNWVGWQHHQTLSLLAAWFLTAETRRAEKKDTCYYVQPSQAGNRIDPSHHARMRYTPSREETHRATPAA